MPPAPIRVLVVDDVHDHAEMVAEFVRLIDMFSEATLEIAGSYDGALQAFERSTFDLAFFDYRLGPRDGLSLLREMRARGIDTPVVFITSGGAEDIAVEAMRAGAADFMSRSQLTVEALGRSIRHALSLAVEEKQRRQAEAALRASEERFRALVENVSDVLLLTDRDGNITYLTPSSLRHLGSPADALAGRSILDVVHPEDREAAAVRFAEVLRRPGERVHAEVRIQHADGSWRFMEGVGVNRLDEPSIGAVVVSARDVTSSRRLEEQLRQAQKMDAVGRLAGGVAHDFNNLLTAILGYCNLLLEDMPPESPFRHELDQIRIAGERAASLTRQLLAFSRRQMLQPQIVDVNALVTQLERMLRRLLGEDIELVASLADGLPVVRVDPASIEQVVVNLAVNARDAMPFGGRLTVETALVDLDAEYAARHMAVVPGRYVMIAVGDTGVGMDAATRARVFDPFFTTKGQGKGEGLGLSTVYGIVKQSGGYVWVYSEPDHGTVFKIYLPPADQGLSARGAGEGEDGQTCRGSETVLLVEDEDAVRSLAAEVLRRQGYTVIEASHGFDAIRLAEHHVEPIDLLVTDVVMPYMSGRDLAGRLGEVRAQMKVLFISGYTDHAVVYRDLTPGSAFLQKPFTPDAFARKVRAILDAHP